MSVRLSHWVPPDLSGVGRSKPPTPSTSTISRAPSKKFWKSLLRAPSTSTPSPQARELSPPWLHPGRAARAVADGLTVAWFGQLNPAEAQPRKLRQSVYVGEIYLDRLYRLPLRQPIAQELSRFQPVDRDFSFVFADSLRWQSIADALGNLHIAELTRFSPREIFRDPSQKGQAGHYSILIRVTFQALERTLRDEELQSYSQAVTAALESLGGRQRA